MQPRALVQISVPSNTAQETNGEHERIPDEGNASGDASNADLYVTEHCRPSSRGERQDSRNDAVSRQANVNISPTSRRAGMEPPVTGSAKPLKKQPLALLRVPFSHSCSVSSNSQTISLAARRALQPLSRSDPTMWSLRSLFALHCARRRRAASRTPGAQNPFTCDLITL